MSEVSRIRPATSTKQVEIHGADPGSIHGSSIDGSKFGWWLNAATSNTGSNHRTQQLAMVIGLCVFGVLGRLLIDIPNFKPTMAVALISGSLFKDWRYAIAAPLLSMLLTDFWFGGYELPLMVAVYSCMLVPVLWSRAVDCRWISGRIGQLCSWNLGAVATAALFFIVTNIVCWAATPWYPQTVEGLLHCFVNALPFLRWMVLGNLLFVNLMTVALYGLELALSRKQQRNFLSVKES